jgi:membrane protein DedA with SNARE-associated domain
MTAFFELLVVLLTSFGFNLIPFAGPSNLFIASNAAILLSTSDPLVLVAVGFLVAFGASFAKGLHYIITFFLGKHLKGKQREQLDADAMKLKRWAFWLLFAAAATPVPDEPIVIPLGLMKYSPTKFFIAFFLGKLSITVAGAFLGAWGGKVLSEWLSPELMVALSIVLTVLVTIILLRVDVGKIVDKYLKKKPGRPKNAASSMETTKS